MDFMPRWLSGIIAVGAAVMAGVAFAQGRSGDGCFGVVLALGNGLFALLPDERGRG